MSQDQLPVVPEELAEFIRAHNERVRSNTAIVATAIALNPGVMTYTPQTPNEAQRFADAFTAALKRADEAALKHAGSVALANIRRNSSAGSAQVMPFPRHRTAAARQRERRSKAGRSSSRSGDSGSDDGGSEPPTVEPWRWASEASWRVFVASVKRRDFEDEVAIERWSR
jgi:hypothetical protein